jgi:hypothetical protein
LDGFCFEQSHIHAPLWIRNKLLLLMLTAKSKIFVRARQFFREKPSTVSSFPSTAKPLRFGPFLGLGGVALSRGVSS